MSTWGDVVALADQLVDNKAIRAAGVLFMDLSRSVNCLKTDKSRAEFQTKLFTARHRVIDVVLREAKLKTSADQLVENSTVKEAMQWAFDLGRRIKRLERTAPDEAEHEIAETHSRAIQGILWEAVQLGEELPELSLAALVEDGDPGPASGAVVVPVEDGDPGPASGAVVAPVPMVVSVQAGDPGPASGAVVPRTLPIKGILKNPDEDEPDKTPPDDAPRTEKVRFGAVQEEWLSETTKKEDRLNARNAAKDALGDAEPSRQKRAKKVAKAEQATQTEQGVNQATQTEPGVDQATQTEQGVDQATQTDPVVVTSLVDLSADD